MIADLGETTFGAAVPVVAELGASLQASVNVALPEITAQLDVAAALGASLDLGGLDADLDVAAKLQAGIQAMIALGIEPPSVDLNASLQADLKASLSAGKLTLEAALALWARISLLLATGGVRMLTYSGPVASFGSELSGLIGGESGQARAIVLMATADATWTALQGILKTS